MQGIHNILDLNHWCQILTPEVPILLGASSLVKNCAKTCEKECNMILNMKHRVCTCTYILHYLYLYVTFSQDCNPWITQQSNITCVDTFIIIIMQYSGLLQATTTLLTFSQLTCCKASRIKWGKGCLSHLSSRPWYILILKRYRI